MPTYVRERSDMFTIILNSKYLLITIFVRRYQIDNRFGLIKKMCIMYVAGKIIEENIFVTFYRIILNT